ncbi:hypothetical protein ANCDUO_15454, partial [Ancylostoma duodenale]
LIYRIQAQLQFWIRDKSKARIKCVNLTCPVRIHENDINAVLDEQEDGLNLFMPLDHRQWLQYYHNKDVIYYALGGNDMVKQCPLCKARSIHHRLGPPKVVPSITCSSPCTRKKKAAAMLHVQICDVGLVFVGNAATPSKASLISQIGIPLFVFFAFPTFIAQRVYDNATSKTDYLTHGEWALVIFKLIEDSYDLFLPLASRLGLGPYKQMLKDGKEAKRKRKQLLKEQAEMESSERAEIVEVSSRTRESTPVESGTGGT